MENDLRRPGESDWEAFERGVDAAMASAPKPRRRPLQSFPDALAELGVLLNNPAVPRDSAELALRFVKKSNKSVVVHPEWEFAPVTSEPPVLLQPSDGFLRLIAAIKAGDWEKVAVIEHEAASS